MIVITAVYERTAAKYDSRDDGYVQIEVGVLIQNIRLQDEPLDLGTVFIGICNDEQVKKALQLQEHKQPLGLIPVGKVQ